jgi:hypothetical protein
MILDGFQSNVELEFGQDNHSITLVAAGVAYEYQTIDMAHWQQA